jgi:hypothetical protein
VLTDDSYSNSDVKYKLHCIPDEDYDVCRVFTDAGDRLLLAQEVTQPVLHEIIGYTTQNNIGTSRRGTAIVARDGINLANVIRLPSGRAIAARFRDLWLIKVNVPSGAARRQERETFYASELPLSLTDSAHHIVREGDVKCLLEKGDATGTLNYSRALANLIRGMNLQDAWQGSADRPTYTH